MNLVLKIILAVILFIASIFDVKEHRIPNWLIGIGIGIGLITTATLTSFLIKVACIAGLFLFGTLHLMGFGDIKLLMVIASFLRFWNMVFSLGVAALLFVIASFITNFVGSRLIVNETVSGLLHEHKLIQTFDEGRPFAPYLFVGTVIVMIFI